MKDKFELGLMYFVLIGFWFAIFRIAIFILF